MYWPCYRGGTSRSSRAPRSGSGDSDVSKSEAANPDALGSRGSDLKTSAAVPEVIGDDLPPTLLEVSGSLVLLPERFLV